MIRLMGLCLIAACLCACSKNNASNTSLSQTPPEKQEREEPPPEEPRATDPSGPVAGSVYDVVSPQSGMPKDVLQAMAGYEVKSVDRASLWRTLPVDLDGDGSKELLISNVFEWCGSGGCGVWLWQRTRKGLRNLLPTENILAEAVALDSARTNGYRNIRIYSRKFGKHQEGLLVSDLYTWRGSAYMLSSSRQHGRYMQSDLPEEVWKVVP